MERIILHTIIILLGIQLLNAQNNNFELYKGNQLYNEGKFEQASGYFDKAIEKEPNDHRAVYNLGNSLFRTENYEKAENHYKNVAASAPSNKEKAAAYHNLGNVYMLQKKIDPAIEAYKDALRKNPHDEATRYNLAYAMEMKKNQEQNQDQNKNQQDKDNKDNQQDEKNKEDQQNQENNEKDENKDQNKDQQEQEDDQQKNDKEDENQDSSEKDPKEEEQNQQPKPNEISKEQAERMLDAINQLEKGVKKKVDEDKSKKKGVVNDEKDW